MMDTIIVPTDFSETADNALKYAIELAKLVNSKIILLHVSGHKLSNEQKQINTEAVHQLETGMNGMSTPIELIAPSGIIEDAISNITKEKNADLIIIGMPENGAFEETILGNNAVNTIRNSTAPILIIPSKVKFRIPTKIVFATDYIELKNDHPLYALLNFIILLKSKLFIVNVMGEDEKTSSKKVAAIINAKKVFSKIDHSFFYPYNENVINGINEFVTQTDSEIVAMIPHKHNVFYKLFNLSNTKKMIFHSSVAILALPENMPLTSIHEVDDVSYTIYDISNINNEINIF